MHCRDLILQISFVQVRDAVDGQMDGDSAKGIEDDENNRHDAGVGIPFAVEDFVRVEIPLLNISRIKLTISFLAKDHLRC